MIKKTSDSFYTVFTSSSITPSHHGEFTLSRVWSGAKCASCIVAGWWAPDSCDILVKNIFSVTAGDKGLVCLFLCIVEPKSFHNLLCRVHDRDWLNSFKIFQKNMTGRFSLL